MNNLIEKLRQAKSPSRELGDEVLLACGWKGYDPQGSGILVSHWTDPNKKSWPTKFRPNPTEDINAAMELVSKWADIELYISVWGTDYSVTAVDIIDHTDKILGRGTSTTPAIAICLAVLETQINK